MTLKINVPATSLVQLTIKEGKVFWQVPNDGTPVYARGSSKAFNFTDTRLISMTWEQFRLFKISGKRGGSVAITKDLFIREFPRRERLAEDTWVQLTQKGILDRNYRLSHVWHFTSSAALTLDQQSIPYPEICTAFNNILDNPNNAEKIDCIPGAHLYRPARSIKQWCANTGRIKGFKPTSEDYRVRLWDVGTYQHLNNHAQSHDGLEHDHIPSSSHLMGYKQSKRVGRDSDEKARSLIKSELIYLGYG